MNHTIARICCLFSAAACSLGLDACPAFGSPTKVVYSDQPTCDPLFIPLDVDELGSTFVPFPADELIRHQDLGQGQPVCTSTDDPLLVDSLVEIVNLTSRTFSEVWYVADRDTTITNVDGFAEDAGVAASGVPVSNYSFRIDNSLSDPNGIHHPLIFESNPNGLFEPGETWQFVLQDYQNALGLPPDAFTSIGIGSASIDIPGIVGSSGSIIAVPEPQAFVWLALALAGVAGRRRV